MKKIYDDSALDGGSASAKHSYAEDFAYVRRYGVTPDPTRHYLTHIYERDTTDPVEEFLSRGYRIETEIVAGYKWILSCPRFKDASDPGAYSYEGKVEAERAKCAAMQGTAPEKPDMIASNRISDPIVVDSDPDLVS